MKKKKDNNTHTQFPHVSSADFHSPLSTESPPNTNWHPSLRVGGAVSEEEEGSRTFETDKYFFQ
jgi:hypothetical protein